MRFPVRIAVAAYTSACVILHMAPDAFAQASLPLENLPKSAGKHVDFAADVKPLLAKNCFHCHGPDAQEAGLRLDTRKSAFKGSDSGPVIMPGKSAESRLIQMVAGLDKKVGRMPPEDDRAALSGEQIGILRAWIDQGAEWPAAWDDDSAAATRKALWSLRPISKPELPTVAAGSWIRNPVDAFILAKLEREQVAPSMEAERVVLLRRVVLDLTGLPPSLGDVEEFLADRRSDAYERVVDRLLESPHFGERWGRHWLDLAHYADSDGYEKDLGRPFAWRYRDWVIEAINRDLPFDTFTVQQLAGDLLTPRDPEYDEAAVVATGFQRNMLVNREGGIDPEEDRVKRTIDRANTVGSVWLGLTVGCANCHSHKYDPISQQEYFRLYAFFNNLGEVDRAVPTNSSSRNPEVQSATKPERVESDQFQAVAEEKRPRETYVHLRGDFLAKGPVVEPGTPEALPPLHSRGERPDRLDLARWLVSFEHPLTARVVANRVWQTYFGRGLVPTADDFGTQGETPSHPQLLDWLASELQSSGWRMKQFHKLIVTSATYRQSSADRPDLADRDPYNTWLARQNRLRVEAEIVRDLALESAGLLNPAIGGPSVRPPQPTGVSDVTFDSSAKWIESTGPERYRRGLYIWFQRTSPYPALVGFDAPESILACTRRERSDTPLQALMLLNDAVYIECAQAVARRMVTEAPTRIADDGRVRDERIRYAFQIALSRPPGPTELIACRDLYNTTWDAYQSAPRAARRLAVGLRDTSSRSADVGERLSEFGACVAVARAILNLDEFITRE